MNGSIFSDSWQWWRNELLQSVPLRFLHNQASKSPIVINILRGNCLIEKRTGSSSEILEGTSIERVGERTKLLTHANSCAIAISEGRYISRHLSDRKLPFTRARQMAEIDLAEGTPFEAGDVHICFVENSHSTDGTEYFLIRKDVLDPVIERLLEADIRPQSIVVKAPHGELRLSRQSLKSIHREIVRKTWPVRLLTASLALLLVSGILTFGHIYYRYAEADEQLTAQVDAKQKAALEVRKLLDRREREIAVVEAARKSKAQAVPVVRVWEELTRVLPDTAWITDFSLNGDSLSFSGSAVSAAELISILDASPLFADPSFTSPVVRVPGQAGERFAIKLSVVRS